VSSGWQAHANVMHRRAKPDPLAALAKGDIALTRLVRSGRTHSPASARRARPGGRFQAI